VDLNDYRESELERARTADLLELSSCEGDTAIDVGTRDGHFARLLADRFPRVTALDLARPVIPDRRISCVAGDVRKLPFEDNSFDLVVCAEVLEHIPPTDLRDACRELARITRRRLVIGVPYKQDTRVGRTTCLRCGTRNPPWGHVNRFDETKLRRLFSGLEVERTSFVGASAATTNFVASSMMSLAGNPYGTYGQDELCIRCGAKLLEPPPRRFDQKVLTRLAFWAAHATSPFKRQLPIWIHLLFRQR
jgi:SAM-dependent methyltransferase